MQFRSLRNGSKSLRISSVGLSMLLVVSFAATLMQPSAAQAGGFSDSCTGKQLVFEFGTALLKAECFDRDGQKRPSSLVISNYVANYGGNLSWARDGNFQRSCSDPHLGQLSTYSAVAPASAPPYGMFLLAKCGDGKGGSNDSSLDLDRRISNQNGVLAFDGF